MELNVLKPGNAAAGTVSFNSGTHALNGATSFNGVVEVPTGVTLNTNGNLILENGASCLSQYSTVRVVKH